MANKAWITSRRSDADVVSAFEAIAAAIGCGDTWTLHIVVLPGQPVLVNGAWSSVKSSTPLAQLLNVNEPLAHQFNAGFPNVPGATLQLIRQPDTNDTVTLNVADGQSPEQFIPFFGITFAKFPTLFNAIAIEKLLGAELANFYRARETAVLRLEGISQKLIEDTDQYRLTLDVRNDELRARLETDTNEQRDRLQRESDARQAALDERAAELEGQKKTLDDRQSRHARRALRQDLQKVLADRSKDFSLTLGTSKKRLPIHLLFISALALDATLIVSTIVSAWGKLDAWPVVIKLAAGVLGFTIILILYIRWADQWFRQHADEEFRLKRMSLDVDRASWVVETAMEWQQQNNAPIPPLLLEELARGLFTGQGDSSAIKHPVEDLASSLLGAAANLEVNIPGVGKATLGRGGVKQLRNAMEARAPTAEQ